MDTALLVLVVVVALGFDFTNGFHDTANAVATSVSTRALPPRTAVAIASIANLVGAFVTTAVAKTVGSGVLETGLVTTQTILAGLFGAIAWNLFTWWLGLPSSSSHALIGGLCGAALATAGGNWAVLIWSATDKKGAAVGLWPKVVMPMFSSPLLGFVGGALLMWLLMVILR